ncbi:MAG TPA: hypothetical protein DCF68_17355 [Cyanothece sp. UBA12306]|nr:hypothetical protein [Cyanothece sp. UBA12306]
MDNSKISKNTNPWATLFFVFGALHLYGQIKKSEEKSAHNISESRYFGSIGENMVSNHRDMSRTPYFMLGLVGAFIAAVIEILVL